MSETMEINPLAPQPGVQTSSFKVTLVALALPTISFIMTLLVMFGVVASDLADELRKALVEYMTILTSTLGIGSAGVSMVYVQNRGKVSVEKARAVVEAETFKTDQAYQINPTPTGQAL